MQNKHMIFLLLALTCLVSVPTQAANSIGYWHTTSGDIIRNGFGECVRTKHWLSSNALPECEGEMPKKVTVVDADNDSIVDANDDCPGTVAGTVVNKRGCELKADISLDNVQFKIDTAELSPDSRSILDNIAKILQENQHLRFEVAGHTDTTGDQQYNVDLSNSRAQSVRQYLIDKGVMADRLTARGYGEDKPLASNDTREGRKQNRRVELVLQQ